MNDDHDDADIAGSHVSEQEELRRPLLSSQEDENHHDDNSSSSSSSSSITPPQENQVLVDGLPRSTSYLLKSLYFLDALSAATWGRFAVLYYSENCQWTPEQIGQLEACMTIIPIITMPLWGLVSDCNTKLHSSWSNRKVVFLSTKAISTFLLLGLSLPSISHHFWKLFATSLLMKAFVAGGILDSYTIEMLGTQNKSLYGRYRLFASISWGLGAIVMGYVTDIFDGNFAPNFVLYGVLGMASLILSALYIPDDTTHTTSTSSERIDERSSNSIHSNHPAEADEAVSQQVDDDEERNDPVEVVVDQPPPPTTLLLLSQESESLPANEPLLLDATVTTRVPESSTESDNDGDSFFSLIKFLLRHPKIVLFAVQAVIMGAGVATAERLVFLYMVNDLQASTLLCGLSVWMNVIPEIPIFWHATWFLQVFQVDGLMAIAMVGYIIRAYGYTLLTQETRHYILVLELLHGVTFACFWTVLTDVIKSILISLPQRNNKKWNTTVPVLIQTCYTGIGVALGSLFGGYAMQHYGSKVMYQWMGGIVASMLGVHLLGSVLIRRIHSYGRGAGASSLLPQAISSLPGNQPF